MLSVGSKKSLLLDCWTFVSVAMSRGRGQFNLGMTLRHIHSRLLHLTQLSSSHVFVFRSYLRVGRVHPDISRSGDASSRKEERIVRILHFNGSLEFMLKFLSFTIVSFTLNL